MNEIGKDFLSVSSLAQGSAKVEQAMEQSQIARQGAVDTGKSNVAGDTKKVDEAARNFEALLLHQMLKSMWESVPAGGLFGDSNEAQMYRDMFNEALADSISEGQGIGVRDMVAKDLKRLEGYKGK
jgi:Rod binding domain-containing protein